MTSGNGSDRASLEYTYKYNPPMNHAVAERNLKEAKQILNSMGVVFLLFSGACLGAIRDKAFIAWDDDIDLISVVGANGLTEEKITSAVNAFKSSGYYVHEINGPYSRCFSMVRDWVRIGWDCDRIIDDKIDVYPGIPMPARLFTQPKEIEFLGEKFFVPNPPEEYLRLKYGAEWMVPKKAGEYEKDVVEKIPSVELVGRSCSIRVLDRENRPVSEAEVALVGGSRSKTDERGYAEVILPGPSCYALIIRYPGHEQILYMEEIEPDKTYVYKSDAASNAADITSGAVGTLGNVLLLE
jgi:hypothetical protein